MHLAFLLNPAYLFNGAVSWADVLTLTKQLQTSGKITVCTNFLGRFRQKIMLDWLLWNVTPTTWFEGSASKGLLLTMNLATLGQWEQQRDHKLYFQESLHHRLNNPESLQMWWRKTVPVQVLLRADPPFIKGFFTGFPSGSAVWTDWYAPLQRTLGPLRIWLQLEAVGDCDISGRLWDFPSWVKGKEDTVTKAYWGANRCDRLTDSSKYVKNRRF